jgi:hypothetical protein
VVVAGRAIQTALTFFSVTNCKIAPVFDLPLTPLQVVVSTFIFKPMNNERRMKMIYVLLSRGFVCIRRRVDVG